MDSRRRARGYGFERSNSRAMVLSECSLLRPPAKAAHKGGLTAGSLAVGQFSVYCRDRHAAGRVTISEHATLLKQVKILGAAYWWNESVLSGRVVPNKIQPGEHSMGGGTDGTLYMTRRSSGGTTSGTCSSTATTTTGTTTGSSAASATLFTLPRLFRGSAVFQLFPPAAEHLADLG